MRPLGRISCQKKGINAILRPLGAIFCHERYGKLQGSLIGRFRMVACWMVSRFRLEEEPKSPSRRRFGSPCLEGGFGSHRLDPCLEED